MLVSASLAMGLWLIAASCEEPLVTVPDPHAALKREPEEQRKARHATVAAARSGTVVVLHRGAWEYAPENTLSAFRAGFELGARGVEIDFRRTKDGVIVLFHDDRLERLVDGVGSVEQSYYEEHPSAEMRLAVAWNLGMIAKHRPELVSDSTRAALVRLLADRETDVRSEAAVACGRARIESAAPLVVKLLANRPDDLDRWTEDESRQQEKRTIIEARARYAFALGLLGAKSRAATDVLVDAVKHRAMHRDLMLVGLDGAMAAWALGRLRAADSVGALSEALFRDDPALEKVRSASGYSGDAASPARWWDFNMHEFIPPALAEIGSDEALNVLETALDPTLVVIHKFGEGGEAGQAAR